MEQDLSVASVDAERRALEELRARRTGAGAGTTAAVPAPPDNRMTLGQRVADQVARTMGSWRFIIVQTFILLVWIALNATAIVQKWDPYPFILLNLGLSFQAAYAAPFIMMSQNRQQEIDRREAETDYKVNIKAELEIELLHQKIDELRQKEMVVLAEAVRDLARLLQANK